MTRRRAIALHEAAHAIAAQKVGLTVSWVTVDSGHAEGQHFTAAVQIPDETLDLERDRHAVLVAMIAPSYMTTFDRDIDRYAQLEAQLALQVAAMHGCDQDEIMLDADEVVDAHREEIVDLALRLDKEGTVVFETA